MNDNVVHMPRRPEPEPDNPDTDPLSGEQIAEFMYTARRLDESLTPTQMHEVIRTIRNMVASWPGG
jgi:hypothetical protein